MRRTRTALAVFIAGMFALPCSALSGTIAPGEVRTVEGTLKAVDLVYRTVVVDVPSAKGDLRIGVTLGRSVQPRVDGQTMSLDDLTVGQRTVLRYTRENGKLVGLDLRVRR
jgi:hypothetical protein